MKKPCRFCNGVRRLIGLSEIDVSAPEKAALARQIRVTLAQGKNAIVSEENFYNLDMPAGTLEFEAWLVKNKLQVLDNDDDEQTITIGKMK
jgi:hypothetical protein